MTSVSKNFGSVFALGALVAATGAHVHGQSIMNFDLSGIPNEPLATRAPTTIAEGLASDGLLRGPGVDNTNLTNGFSANNWHVGDGGDSPLPSRDIAIANGEWIGLNVSVLPGYTASLSTLDISLRRSALNGPMFFELQYSLDGFATAGTTVVDFTYRGRSSGTNTDTSFNPEEYMKFGVPDPNDPGAFELPPDLAGQSGNTTDPGNPMPTFDLSAFSDLQEMAAGTEVTFALFAWGNANTTNTNTVAFGRLVGPDLGGTVIPEPSTYALLFGASVLGAVVLLRRRRR